MHTRATQLIGVPGAYPRARIQRRLALIAGCTALIAGGALWHLDFATGGLNRSWAVSGTIALLFIGAIIALKWTGRLRAGLRAERLAVRESRRSQPGIIACGVVRPLSDGREVDIDIVVAGPMLAAIEVKGSGGRVYWGENVKKLFTAVGRNHTMNRKHGHAVFQAAEGADVIAKRVGRECASIVCIAWMSNRGHEEILEVPFCHPKAPERQRTVYVCSAKNLPKVLEKLEHVIAAHELTEVRHGLTNTASGDETGRRNDRRPASSLKSTNNTEEHQAMKRTSIKPCYLEKQRRGDYVGTITEAWRIDRKIDIQEGSKFVVWPMGSDKQGPKLLEFVPPGADVATDAILLAKLHHTEKNRWYGKRKVDLTGGNRITTEADFNLYDNGRNFGLTVS